jgi:hypothetical protein
MFAGGWRPVSASGGNWFNKPIPLPGSPRQAERTAGVWGQIGGRSICSRDGARRGVEFSPAGRALPREAGPVTTLLADAAAA